MTWDEFLKLWRVIVLALGAFDIGFALAVGYSYTHHRLKSAHYDRARHVLSITGSYVLLAGTVWATVFIHAIEGYPQTFRLYTATVAFPLGIYAMVKIVRTK